MSSSLHPYSYSLEGGKYLFRTDSGALYTAYFLDLSSLAPNLFTFNFDRIRDGAAGVVDNRVFDTVCSILERFFQEHRNSMLIVCDTADGREGARMRLFNSWYERIAPEGLLKVDRAGQAEIYKLFVSLLVWDDNPDRERLVAILDEYCQTMLS